MAIPGVSSLSNCAQSTHPDERRSQPATFYNADRIRFGDARPGAELLATWDRYYSYNSSIIASSASLVPAVPPED